MALASWTLHFLENSSNVGHCIMGTCFLTSQYCVRTEGKLKGASSAVTFVQVSDLGGDAVLYIWQVVDRIDKIMHQFLDAFACHGADEMYSR